MFSVQESKTKAQELFQSAMKRRGKKQLAIALSYEATDLFSRIASQLKASFEETFDIKVHLEPLAFKELFQRLRSQQFHTTLIHAVAQYSDPINFLERFEFKDLPRNFSGWEHPEYQAILKQYRKLNDLEQRHDLAKKAEQILLREMPIAPIYYEHYAYLQKPYLHNLGISPVGIVHFDRAFLNHKATSVSGDQLIPYLPLGA